MTNKDKAKELYKTLIDKAIELDVIIAGSIVVHFEDDGVIVLEIAKRDQ